MSVKAGQNVSGFQTCIFSGTAGGYFGDIDAGRHIVCLLDLAADIEAFDADRSLIFCGNLCSGLLIHQIFNDNAIRLRSLSTCSTRTFTC